MIEFFEFAATALAGSIISVGLLCAVLMMLGFMPTPDPLKHLLARTAYIGSPAVAVSSAIIAAPVGVLTEANTTVYFQAPPVAIVTRAMQAVAPSPATPTTVVELTAPSAP